MHCRCTALSLLFMVLLSGANLTHTKAQYADYVAIDSAQHRPGLGLGPATGLIVSPAIDQWIFPGFQVISAWHSHDWLLELKGRFFFGEVDAYHIEGAGYMPLGDVNPRFFAGGGIGYGGMNRKETKVFTINNQPVSGVFYHNGNGLHTFLGITYLYPATKWGAVKFDADYFLTLYHIDDIRMPSGVRLGLSLILHAP